MATEDVQSWSTTAGSNANADAGINWAEGQARASVNNSARSMMAAHAKDRNLRNGSITTAGTANAQTFSSGVSYTGTVPTGLMVKLKVGAGLTNTGATTLNMDGIGAVTVKDTGGRDLAGGAFIAGRYVDLIYNGTNWILLLPNNAIGGMPHCGRLRFVNSSTLSFTPFNGDLIKINGQIYNIPSAGIVGLGNTGVFLNGAAGQNLAATTIYFVYVFDNAGVLTADFSTTSHAASSAAGNVGTEIKTGDNTRTLIGLVATGAGAVFADDPNGRYVLSWFNRQTLALQGGSTGGTSTSSGTQVEILTTARIGFLCWAGEAVFATLAGTVQHNIGGAFVSTTIGLDGVPGAAQACLSQAYIADAFMPAAATLAATPSEALHALSPFGAASGGGTGSFFVYISGSIRG